MKKMITAILLGILLVGTFGAAVVSAIASDDTKVVVSSVASDDAKVNDDLGQMHQFVWQIHELWHNAHWINA